MGLSFDDSARQNPPIKTESELKKSKIYFEIKRLFLLGGSFFLLLGLLTYSPLDPSLTTLTYSHQITNWMGQVGSIFSDLLFQAFGKTAYLVPLGLMAWVLKLPFRHSLDKKFKMAAAAILTITLPALMQWLAVCLHAHQMGGLVGVLAVDALTYLFGIKGCFLVLVLLLACATLLLLDGRGWSTVFKRLGEKLATLKEPSIQSSSVLNHLKQLVRPLWFEKIFFESPEPLEQQADQVEQTDPEALAKGLDKTDQASAAREPDIQKTISLTAENQKKIKWKKPILSAQYDLPDLNLISGKADSKSKPVDKNWYVEKATLLVQKLKDFGVEGEVVHISPGPVITVYEFKPASGVKIKEIANLSDDLTLALSVLSVRIVAPIPGKPVVGIEIPSPHREMVFFKDILKETPFFSPEVKIPIALGRLASGEPITADLASMPHLLIAGSTGTGKSVFINTLIGSLLFRFTPEHLRLILVDPKMVELSQYEGIPHLLLPVVVDSRKAVMALRWAVEEMERRYSLMHSMGVRHLDGFNEKIKQAQLSGQLSDQTPLPYVVVVIDEYADLMAVVPKEVELSIARLAQKARASGIHLVLATQRPSTDVVTGTIKANFPSRISFRVASSVDSKTILDRTGSERLLGHGDLLFHSAGFSTLKRIQGPFISDADTEKVVNFLKEQGEPLYDEKIISMSENAVLDLDSESTGEDDSLDKHYDLAVRLVTEKGEASISLIQRHLRIGYNRAASIMEKMEKEGIVGEAQGPAKRRTVIASSL